MASASDVRGILSLPTATATPGPSQPRKSVVHTVKKPDGISRELYSLIGDSAPSLAAQIARPRLKQKPDLGKTKVKWEWKPFSNSARTDGLQLSHWAKATPEAEMDYPFAKYNTSTPVYSYTAEEYANHLEDPEWTKEETDYLITLIREYDARFYVVADRYDFPAGIQRNIDDLKARYYSICRKLLRSRPWEGDEAARGELLHTFQFDKEREVSRKSYVTGLFSRTAEQIAEEEALFLVLKRLEQNERRFAKERDDLLRNLGGIESGLPGLPGEDEIFSAMTVETTTTNKKKKKKSEAMDLDSPLASSSLGLMPFGNNNPAKKLSGAKQAVHDAQHCIFRHDSTGNAPLTKSAHQAVYLRTARIPAPKATLAPKIYAALTELGISHSRLVMPTRENMAHLEALYDAAGVLVEVKRALDRVDHEVRVHKTHVNDEPNPGGEDVEMADATKRKRSVSVSSVETSATVNTRASMKRQRHA